MRRKSAEIKLIKQVLYCKAVTIILFQTKIKEIKVSPGGVGGFTGVGGRLCAKVARGDVVVRHRRRGLECGQGDGGCGESPARRLRALLRFLRFGERISAPRLGVGA